jgi:hypothetical protein
MFVILVCIVMLECYIFHHICHSICIIDDYSQMFLSFPSLVVAFKCSFNFHHQQVLCCFGLMMHDIRVIHNCIRIFSLLQKSFFIFFSLGFKVLCVLCFALTLLSLFCIL